MKYQKEEQWDISYVEEEMGNSGEILTRDKEGAQERSIGKGK